MNRGSRGPEPRILAKLDHDPSRITRVVAALKNDAGAYASVTASFTVMFSTVSAMSAPYSDVLMMLSTMSLS